MNTIKILALSALALAVHSGAAAQQKEILSVTGASEMEELDVTEAERFEDLLSHPVHINSAPPGRLKSCGLFTRFQAASILDYRSRNGDILSFSELAMLDGFSEETVRTIAPFIHIEGNLPSMKGQDKTEVQMRATGRTDGPWSATMKCRHSFSGGSSISGAFRKKSEQELSWSGCAAIYGRKKRGRLILGDYNARFGQGLGLWSGFSMSGLPTADAFVRRPSGLSPSWSVSPDGPLRGFAADYDAGRTTVSCMLAFPGLRKLMEQGGNAGINAIPAINIARTGHCSEYSVTALAGTAGERKVAADVRWTPGKLGMFAEGAADLSGASCAAVTGLVWTPAYKHKVSILARHYGSGFTASLTGGARASNNPSGERGLAIGIQLPHLSLTADKSFSPSAGDKARVLCTAPLVFGKVTLTPRASVKLREGKIRADARIECALDYDAWSIRAKADAVHGTGNAGLGYCEGVLKSGRFSVFARAGLFIIDNWDDRIYVYERDAPCSFNVPAYHGRGYNGSIFASCKLNHSRIYLRVSGIRYVTGKPGNAELRLQYNLVL